MTAHVSTWRHEQAPTRYPALAGDATVDVVVIGAGITGLTCAALLKRHGRRVAVVERDQIGSGTTGSTTAHLATYPDWGFKTVADKFGRDGLALVASSMQQGVSLIESLAAELTIDCEFHRVPGFLYAEKGYDPSEVEQEYTAARSAQLEVALTRDVPLPFAVDIGLRVPHQGRVHPMRYLRGLAEYVHDGRSAVYERTRVVDFSDGDPCVVNTTQGTLRARQIVLATHTPLGINLLHTLIAPYRSYALTARVRKNPGDALFWDTQEPYNYVRLHQRGAETYVIIGGQDHKTGHDSEPEAFQRLERYARDHFEIIDITERWSAQLFDPSDGVPLIGVTPGGHNVYVATGYSGDGLPFGSVAAEVLTDLVLGHQDARAELFSPSRVKPLAGAAHFVKENVDVAKRFVTDRLNAKDASSLAELPPGSGQIVQLSGKKLAVYRDDGGQLHAMQALCPHMKCVVRWNAAEKSWDCPCHGSRFEACGQPLDGPTLSPLERVAIGDSEDG